MHIAYQHTSHGAHVSYGMYGLHTYKEGDDVLFAIIHDDNPLPGKLDFHDYALESYADPGETAVDLSRDEDAFIHATRNFLDAPENSDVNVVMWSWCSISGHNVSEVYIPGMRTLINEYGPGGSKIGNGPGQRQTPVIFIFMTGHAEGNNNVGDGKPKNQAKVIVNYCNENNYFCLDYYSIDTHDMNDNYWEDTDDNGSSDSYGGEISMRNGKIHIHLVSIGMKIETILQMSAGAMLHMVYIILNT